MVIWLKRRYHGSKLVVPWVNDGGVTGQHKMIDDLREYLNKSNNIENVY